MSQDPDEPPGQPLSVVLTLCAMLHSGTGDQLAAGVPYHELRTPISSSVATEVSGHGCKKHMGSGSRSKMDLSSGFWSYVVEMKTVVRGRKARTSEDPRTKDLG